VLRLYRIPFSTNVERIALALAHKGVTVEWVDVDPADRSPVFAVSGQELVPVLVDGDIKVYDSTLILEYLEERFPDPPLLPRAPELRARVRELSELVNSGIQPLQNLVLRKALYQAGIKPEPFVEKFITSGLQALETRAVATAGRFLVSDSVTFADIYLVPQLHASVRFGVDVSAFPTLLRVERECEALTAFQAAHPNAQPDFEAGA